MLKNLIFLLIISCVPQGGNITLGPQSQGSLSPGPEINTISVVGSQLIIDGYNFSGITYVTLKDPDTDIVKPFEVTSATITQLISESIDTMSVPVNKVLELILANAYGQTTYPVTFTLQPNAVATGNIQDNAVTAAKIPNGGIPVSKLNPSPYTPNDGDVLIWDSGSSTFAFAPYGEGGGGGGIVSITRGVGIANSGTTITVSGPISVDVGKTGDPTDTKIPYFNNNNQIEIANDAEILFSDTTASFSLLNNSGSFVITKGSTATDYFILDDTGLVEIPVDLRVNNQSVCLGNGIGCPPSVGGSITSVTATSPILASTAGNTANISAETGTAQGDLVLLGAPGSFPGVGKLPSVDGSGLLGVITDVLPGTATMVSKFLGNATVDVVFGSGAAQRWQRNLDNLGTLNTNDNFVIIGNGTSFEVQGGDTLLTSIGAQKTNANLTNLGSLSPLLGNIIVGGGTSWNTQIIPNCPDGTGNLVLGNGQTFSCSQNTSPISAGTLTTFNQLGLQIRAAATAGTPTGELRFSGSNNTNYVGFKAAAATSSNTIWELPPSDGTNGQALSTNASGVLSWVAVNTSLADVVGPASSTINAIAKFSDSSGKNLSNSGVLINASNDVSGIAAFTSSGNMTVDTNTLFVDSTNNRVGLLTTSPTEALDVRGNARLGSGTAVGNLKFYDNDASNYVAFQATGTVAANVTWTLPSADGTNGQVLSTNAAGVLSWVTRNSSSADVVGAATSTTNAIAKFIDGTGKNLANTGVLINATNDLSGIAALTSSGNMTVDTNTFFVDAINNRVGIGTSSPSTGFYYSGVNATFDGTGSGGNLIVRNPDANPMSGGTMLLFQNSTVNTGGNYNNYIRMVANSAAATPTTFGSMGFEANNSFEIFNPNNTAVSLQTKGTGNVGVGINNPTNKLQVNGTFGVSGVTTFNVGATSSTFPTGRGTNGQVLTSDGAGALSWATPVVPPSVNAQTGTSYTLASTDCGNTVTLNNAAAITVSMPNLTNGCRIDLIQIGAGQVTGSGSGGMVLQNSFNLFRTRTQYSVLTVTQLTTTLSIVSGDVN